MDALNALTIDRTLKNNITRKIYRGVFPCDRVFKCKLTRLPACVIVNFDKHDEKVLTGAPSISIKIKTSSISIPTRDRSLQTETYINLLPAEATCL